MIVEILSRLQFALTIAFHFIFVPLTVGLILVILLFEIKHYRSNDERYRRLSNYFSDIFLINYAFGIVTGIAMTVQFGTNWSNYTVAMGDIFGSPLLLEAVIAFFLESTFTGIWLFRKNKISNKMRLITVSMITIGTTLSALWIITANGFMQNPVGFSWDGSRVTLESFGALVFNPYAWYMLVHNHLSAFILTGFVVLAISSWHFLNGKEEDKPLFKIAAKYGAWLLLISSILIPIVGFSYMNYITPLQPTKIDMIIGASSGGLETVVYIAYNIMVTTGVVYVILALFTVIFFERFLKSPTVHKIFMYLVPLPYISILTGWMVTEMGRQPYIIYDIMLVSEGISNVPVNQIWFSIISLVIFYILLFIMDYTLTITRIKKGFTASDKNEVIDNE